MIQESFPHIFRIEVPLPRSPLKALNSYVIKGRNRSLVIDTGFNREECQTALEKGFRELKLDLEKTDFFITHMHSDHSGLIEKVVTPYSRVYCSKTDGEVIALGRNLLFWQKLCDFVSMNGFPMKELDYAIETHPGYKYCASFSDFTYVEEQDPISIDGYRFQCVATPGHTKGHLCLYEPHQKIFLSGDHILGSITPNIGLWSYEDNPLEMYLRSLDKVSKLDIKLILPGHRELIENCQARIQELKAHHRHRLAEVLKIAHTKPQNACEIAAQMSWDMTYATWDEFPTPQKWFAVAEALAHIKYLENTGQLRRELKNGIYLFSKA
jgi:glyoxylase-like metal-dependent hydrolase (beta-lactamase superfamily II)